MKYNIKESNYEESIKYNGLKNKNTASAISIKNNEAKYFIIENDSNYLDDFIIYNDNNWITLEVSEEKGLKEIINSIKSFGYNYLTFIIYYKDQNKYDLIKNNLNIIKEEKDYSQYLNNEEFFYKIKISI